jgi:hypothetical protein
MGVRPLAEHRRVGDEPAVLAPQMELIAGRFVHEPNRSGASAVRSRRSCAAVLGAVPGDRAGKTVVDRAVQMAA